MAASGNHIWRPALTTRAAEAVIVTPMNNTATTDTRLLRHVVTTALLAAAAVVVAWYVLFTGPDMGVNRYAPGRVFGTGIGGPAVQTGHLLAVRVVGIQHDPLPSGVPNAQ
jgi:predicted secreted protein